MALSRMQFEQQLSQILGMETGWGWYSRPGVDHEGKPCIYHFSLATGMGHQYRLAKYRKRLGADEPTWVEDVHPDLVMLMCNLAIVHRRRLPKHRPAPIAAAIEED